MNQQLFVSGSTRPRPINNERLQAFIASLATFGGRADGGVSRETLTDIDLASRRYLIDQARALGCEVTVDDCANLFFRRPGQRNDLPRRVDWKPRGYPTRRRQTRDGGAYGVVAGLEVIAALNDAGINTLRPIEVVVMHQRRRQPFYPGAMGSSAFVDPSCLAGYLMQWIRTRYGSPRH